MGVGAIAWLWCRCYTRDAVRCHTYDQHENPLIRALLGRKLAPLLRNASACLCGNEYLQGYARKFCPNSHIIPTVIDTNIYKPVAPRAGERDEIAIGWIGSPTTWRYVAAILPILSKAVDKFGIRVKIIGAGKDRPEIAGFEFADWSEESEVTELQAMDIGIMPLPDEPWARGKCGYKLIQYMACAKPVIASPVGVNSSIVNDGYNGYLAGNSEQWLAALERLIGSADLRAQMGRRGRRKVEAEFSLNLVGPKVALILRQTAEKSRSSQGLC